jgi:uncharacterized protein (DUF1015 family)
LADIRPFHGVHYSKSLVKDPAQVICPPHDIITPQLQQELYARSEYNFVRIELGRELPQDDKADNRYTRAAACLEQWLSRGLLEEDKQASLYVHDHFFSHAGKKHRRRSLTCLVKLEEWDTMVVRPHEGTFSGPREDRLNLLRTLRADTSPIMGLYQDAEGRVSKEMESASRVRPFLAAKVPGGESHRLWPVTDPASIERIRAAFSSQPLYIADGHHRYESALAYRRERRRLAPADSGEQLYDFIMMTLVDFADPGLLILPAHRLVRGVAPKLVRGLPEKLRGCFRLEEVPLHGKDARLQIETLLKSPAADVRLVIYGLDKDTLTAVTLGDFACVRPMIPAFHSELYGRLDVSIVDHVIVEGMMGRTYDQSFIGYTDDIGDAIDMVKEGEYQLAIIVSPIDPQVIKTVADAGDRMPRKSTYFYPKTPAGLVFYRFG